MSLSKNFSLIKKWGKQLLSSNKFFSLQLFYFGSDNLLRKKGWFESMVSGVPVDQDKNPIPWYTYSSVDFLKSRIESDYLLFEYGSGNSTLWYADRVKKVVAVEDSRDWYENISNKVPENVTILHREGKEYIEAVKEHGDFDIVVIDGSNREKCFEPSLNALNSAGIIILDDFDRYNETQYGVLLEKGFKILPFYGLNPLSTGNRVTAIFYRRNNCLDI